MDGLSEVWPPNARFPFLRCLDGLKSCVGLCFKKLLGQSQVTEAVYFGSLFICALICYPIGFVPFYRM